MNGFYPTPSCGLFTNIDVCYQVPTSTTSGQLKVSHCCPGILIVPEGVPLRAAQFDLSTLRYAATPNPLLAMMITWSSKLLCCWPGILSEYLKECPLELLNFDPTHPLLHQEHEDRLAHHLRCAVLAMPSEHRVVVQPHPAATRCSDVIGQLHHY